MNRKPLNKKRKNKKSNKRNRLYSENPNCFWCGKFTLLQTDDLNILATVDHIRNKSSIARQTKGLNVEELTVLSCYKCNNVRSIFEELFFNEINNKYPIPKDLRYNG